MKAIRLLFLITLIFSCASKRPPEDPYDFIGAPLLAKLPAMRECYINSPNYIRNPDSEIRTNIEFEIHKDGTTSDHKVTESSLKDEKFKQCLVNNLKDLKYAPQPEPLIVDQPFNFYPRKP